MPNSPLAACADTSTALGNLEARRQPRVSRPIFSVRASGLAPVDLGPHPNSRFPSATLLETDDDRVALASSDNGFLQRPHRRAGWEDLAAGLSWFAGSVDGGRMEWRRNGPAGLTKKKVWWFGPFPVSGTAFRRHVLMSCALFFLGLVGLSGSSTGSRSDHFFFTGELKDGEGYATAAGQSQALG